MTVSRRRFLGSLSGSLLGLPLAAAACAPFRYVGSRLESGRLIVSLAEFGAGPFALIDAPQLAFPIYLYRDAAGSFTAVVTRCMHRGCQVKPLDGRLVCPCHGSEYDNAGAILKGPTELPLIRLPVAVTGGEVHITL